MRVAVVLIGPKTSMKFVGAYQIVLLAPRMEDVTHWVYELKMFKQRQTLQEEEEEVKWPRIGWKVSWMKK
eukprot:5756647-Ditylum_brightwellii.AAC.1